MNFAEKLVASNSFLYSLNKSETTLDRKKQGSVGLGIFLTK